MGAFKELFLTLLDRMQDLGRQHATEQTALPTDEQLVEYAARLDNSVSGGELLAAGLAVDDDLLAELREAYEEGRRPEIVDMDAVVDELDRLGVPAYVEQTGGGCATIYAGKQADWPDHHGDRRYAASAGPGWFEGPAWTKGRGHTDDFVVGPDDDDQVGENVPDRAQPAQIAQMVAGVVRDVEARRQRVEDVLAAAGEAFWRAVAEGFPEVVSGDFGPDETLAIEQAMRQAILRWLYYNRPEKGIAPTAVAAGCN